MPLATAVVGRTLAVAVYRPLAEQLVTIAQPGADERVLELSAGDGELTTRMAATVSGRPATVVVGTQQQAHHLRAAVAPLPVQPVVVHAWGLPFGDDEFDLAVSLLAIDGAGRPARALAELARVARRAVVAVWTDGATHEEALRDARHEVGVGEAPRNTALAVDVPPGWTARDLLEVARFDGIGQVWAAMIDERAIAVPHALAAALRERLAFHLAPFTAADGTMRIPVRASVLTLLSKPEEVSPR